MIAVFFPISGGEWQGAKVELPKAVTRAVHQLRLVSDNTRRDLEALARTLQPTAAPADADTLTVAQFAAARGLQLSVADMQRLGRAATKYSRQHGMTVGRTVDGLFGEVNSYARAALENALTTLRSASWLRARRSAWVIRARCRNVIGLPGLVKLISNVKLAMKVRA
jgi:hypothetical protein